MASATRQVLLRAVAALKATQVRHATSSQLLLSLRRRCMHCTPRRRSGAVQQQRNGEPTPRSGPTRPTRREDDDLAGLIPVLATFFGAFGLTVGLNYLYNNDPGPSRLLPDRYNGFRLASVRHCSSLMAPAGVEVGNPSSSPLSSEHVHLAIEPPSYIAPPKLSKEQVDALVGVGGSLGNVWRIVSIRMKEPDLQIERPYTPLYASALMYPRGDGKPIDLLIKRYPDGELGRYAHRLGADQVVEIRGPEVTWQGTKKDELVMIVGGTGITPAYQLATSILGRPDDEINMLQAAIASPIVPRISILYAATRPSSFLLLPELARLKAQYGDRLHVQLLADRQDSAEASTALKQTHVSWTDWLLRRRAYYTLHDLPVQIGGIDDESVRGAMDGAKGQKQAASTVPPAASASRQVLVCGPDGMVAHVAGPKQPQSQGPIGGILQRLGVAKEEVWKL